MKLSPVFVLLLLSSVSFSASGPRGAFPRDTRTGIDTLFRKHTVAVVTFTHRVKPVLRSGSYPSRYRKYIENGVSQPVNFGGRYRIITWGCGTNCLSGVVLDLKTGRVVPIPTCEWGVEFRKDSLLLIENPPGKDTAANRRRPDWARPRYWVWRDRKFFLLGIGRR